MKSYVIMYGSITQNILKNLRVDKCFLGTNGIDVKYGYSVPTLEDAAVKMYMLESSKQRFILADHTKFREAYMNKFADFHDEIDYLITDSFPHDDDRDLYEANIHLVICDEYH